MLKSTLSKCLHIEHTHIHTQAHMYVCMHGCTHVHEHTSTHIEHCIHLAGLGVINTQPLHVQYELQMTSHSPLHTHRSQMGLPPLPAKKDDPYSPSYDVVGGMSQGHEYEVMSKVTNSDLYEEIGLQHQEATQYTQCPAYAAPTTMVTIFDERSRPARNEEIQNGDEGEKEMKLDEGTYEM